MGLWIWGEGPSKQGSFLQHRVKGAYLQRDLSLTMLIWIPWLVVVFAMFLSCKFTFLHLPVLLGSKPLGTAHIQGVES